jgi:SAM-dependent methyltransferase
MRRKAGAPPLNLDVRRHKSPLMTTVFDHYATHLGPIYLWMAGGFDRAVEIGRSDLAATGVPLCADMSVLDPGAGFGMHAIPLAEACCAVTAVDSSTILLKELTERSQGLPIEVVECDLLQFRENVLTPQSFILCMGDTLTHLQTNDEVEHLFAEISRALTPDGKLAITYRDYTVPPIGTRRFIPVRSDANRIHTCFLETASTHINVHDIIHERRGDTWQMQVSDYQKLRLSPLWVLEALQKAGLEPKMSQGPRGMIQVVASVA